MDEPVRKPGNNRGFFLPLVLLSLVFYSFYFIILGWIFSGPIQSQLIPILSRSSEVVDSSLFYLIIEIVICILSLAGAFLFAREMKTRSLIWISGLPLCLTLGVIIFSSSLIPVISFPEVQKFLGGVIFFGFAFLPLCLAYLLNDVKGIESDLSDIESIRSSSLHVGIFGFVLTLLLILLSVAQPPSVSSHSSDQMWNFGSPLILIGLVLYFIYVAFLLPVLGSDILGLGLKYR